MPFRFFDNRQSAIYEITGETEEIGGVLIPMARLVARIRPLAEVADDLLAQDLDLALTALMLNQATSQ